MRCLSCNCVLTDYEATRRYSSNSSKFVDLCNDCFAPIAEEVPTINRSDLQNESDDLYAED